MSETHSVKRHLDVEADAYDVQIRRFIPHYDDMLATGVELLGSLSGPEPRVVDLGGGTGALAAAVLRGLPRARVTVLDVDPEMLAVASERLAAFGDRADFREASFLDSLPEADAVVASLCAPPRARPRPQDRSLPGDSERPDAGRRVPQPRRRGQRRPAGQPADLRSLGGPHGGARHPGRRGARALSPPGPRRTATSPSTRSSPLCAGPASRRSNASGAGGSAPSVAGCARRRRCATAARDRGAWRPRNAATRAAPRSSRLPRTAAATTRRRANRP